MRIIYCVQTALIVPSPVAVFFCCGVIVYFFGGKIDRKPFVL